MPHQTMERLDETGRNKTERKQKLKFNFFRMIRLVDIGLVQLEQWIVLNGKATQKKKILKNEMKMCFICIPFKNSTSSLFATKTAN